MLWTRHMHEAVLHEAFQPQGCAGAVAPMRAVTLGAGSLWAHAYDAVTTHGGGYVQGGGCMTVGVAGLVQSGGFGSFSKAFGLACAGLLEAEVVTADGVTRITNACNHPDLFWGLKGGGGSTLGVVTRLTLRVHELPETFGAVNFTVRASSPAAFRRLIRLVIDFYARSLMNPHWGEQVRLRSDNVMSVAMVFQGLSRRDAVDIWQPFLDALARAPQDFAVDLGPLTIVSTSARTFWAPTLLKRALGFISRDDRAGAAEGNVFWPGDQGEAGQVLHGYQSAWLPASLLRDAQRSALCEALFAATRHWGVALHFNKGLAGAPSEALAASRDTATNPAVLDAFALAICVAGEQPAYPGVVGHEPNIDEARGEAGRIANAMDVLRRVVPEPGSYVSESNYFESDWQRSFWGSNYERLLAVKNRYDPQGLFFVHHGVGSDRWSADGFTRLE
jgi:FAD/FMN-containing dehydrogenase